MDLGIPDIFLSNQELLKNSWQAHEILPKFLKFLTFLTFLTKWTPWFICTANFRCCLKCSISRTSLYLKQFIWSLGHLALDQCKNFSVSRILISLISVSVKQILQCLEQFSFIISNFSQNVQKVLQLFFSN